MAWFLLALCAAGAYWFVRHRRVEKTRSAAHLATARPDPLVVPR